MNSFFLAIILVPIIEIYLLIKIGSKIGALSTILLIFTTAVVGVYYAKYEGLNTLKSGFATDIFGFLLIFPLSRKFIFSKFKSKIKKKENLKKDFIEGDFEDIEDDNDRKL